MVSSCVWLRSAGPTDLALTSSGCTISVSEDLDRLGSVFSHLDREERFPKPGGFARYQGLPQYRLAALAVAYGVSHIPELASTSGRAVRKSH